MHTLGGDARFSLIFLILLTPESKKNLGLTPSRATGSVKNEIDPGTLYHNVMDLDLDSLKAMYFKEEFLLLDVCIEEHKKFGFTFDPESDKLSKFLRLVPRVRKSAIYRHCKELGIPVPHLTRDQRRAVDNMVREYIEEFSGTTVALMLITGCLSGSNDDDKTPGEEIAGECSVM